MIHFLKVFFAWLLSFFWIPAFESQTVPIAALAQPGGGGGDDDQSAIAQFASRVVSQDDVEDGDVLVPIFGLNATPALLALASIRHIVDTCPEFAARVEADGGWTMPVKAAEMFAKKIVDKPNLNPHKLLVCFIMAIHMYTQEWALYKELNARLRSRDRKRLMPFFPYLRLLLTAFTCIPPSASTVFRGVKRDLVSKFKKGEQVIWWSVTSTTTSMGTLQEELFLGKTGKRTMFCISTKSFRDIRHYSAIGIESESCGLPGTCFDVDDLLDQGDLQIVQMSENLDDCLLNFVPKVADFAALEAPGASGLPTTFLVSSHLIAGTVAENGAKALSEVNQAAAEAQAAVNQLVLCNSADVALLVQSAGPDFEAKGYGRAVLNEKVNGDFILKANEDDLSALFSQMNVKATDRPTLRQAFVSWKVNPAHAFDSLVQLKQKAESDRKKAQLQKADAERRAFEQRHAGKYLVCQTLN
jgi:hypothetical protein